MRVLIPLLVLGLGVLALSGGAYAKPEFTKREKKACVYCHVAPKTGELNDAGKYYQTKRTLKGYKPKERQS